MAYSICDFVCVPNDGECNPACGGKEFGEDLTSCLLDTSDCSRQCESRCGDDDVCGVDNKGFECNDPEGALATCPVDPQCSLIIDDNDNYYFEDENGLSGAAIAGIAICGVCVCCLTCIAAVLIVAGVFMVTIGAKQNNNNPVPATAHAKHYL